MAEKIELHLENCVVIHIRKEISEREMEEIERTLEDRIRRHEKLRLLVIMDSYPTFNSAESIYEDLRFAKTYADHIERMAVIGDQSWKKHWIALFGLFGGITAEYFVRSDVNAAVDWLQAP